MLRRQRSMWIASLCVSTIAWIAAIDFPQVWSKVYFPVLCAGPPKLAEAVETIPGWDIACDVRQVRPSWPRLRLGASRRPRLKIPLQPTRVCECAAYAPGPPNEP